MIRFVFMVKQRSRDKCIETNTASNCDYIQIVITNRLYYKGYRYYNIIINIHILPRRLLKSYTNTQNTKSYTHAQIHSICGY